MVLRCPIARSVIGLSPDADVAQKLQSSHTDRAAHAHSCCCAPRSVARYRLAAIGTALHAPGSLKSASSKGAHMAHQTEAAEGCVRVPADGGTSSLECVSIWLS